MVGECTKKVIMLLDMSTYLVTMVRVCSYFEILKSIGLQLFVRTMQLLEDDQPFLSSFWQQNSIRVI